LRANFLLLTALLTPQLIAAQSPLPANALRLDSQTFVELQTRLSSENNVRVHGVLGTVYVRQPTLTRDSLLGAIDRSGTPGPRLGLVDVTRIQTRGNANGTGGLVGAGVGLAAGLAAGFALVAYCSDGGGCTNGAGGVVFLTVGSTAAGALLGALIGTQVTKWHTVYQAP
jgi:hypothetical protein